MSASPQKRTSERLLRFFRFVTITTKIHSSKQCAIRSLVQRWCGPVDGSKLLRLAGRAGHGAPTCACLLVLVLNFPSVANAKGKFKLQNYRAHWSKLWA